ncbi:LacI family DNA-binding transcriptional regulator [Kitasatospora sp. NPDC051853]|uniref:LacI family DNA-binding transcriptional regulator n=1 Tax=Kitasatospora sp. NPDC051853 TaxID=3364058 RepID=UPI00378972A6
MSDEPPPVSPAGAPARLATIAERAGVSPATVSRVLNHRPGVAARTRITVEKAIAELNLSRSTGDELVIVVAPELSNEVFALLAGQLTAEFGRFGMHTMISAIVPGTSNERDLADLVLRTGAAGVVFLSSGNTPFEQPRTAQQAMAQRRMPFVGVNGTAAGITAPVFSTDDRYGAELAIDHLHRLGHRHIGILTGPPGNPSAEHRLDGLREALRTRGLDDHDARVERQLPTVEGGRHGTGRLIEQGVTAVVAAGDRLALGAADAAERHGLRIPADLSLVAHEDAALLERTAPPLTAIRQPTEKLAGHAAQALRMLLLGAAPPPGGLLIQPELRIRRSTAAAP